MKHFERYHKPKFSAKEYLLPLMLEYVVLLVCIRLHRLLIYRGPLLGEAILVGDELSAPTVGRLVFCILSFAAAVCLTALASRKAKLGEVTVPFVCGSFAGTFFWQSLGEDAWNFAIDGVNFVQLESVSVFPLVIVTILFLIYAARNHALDWGIWCTLSAFLVNWWGHYVTLGSYPFVSGWFEEGLWVRNVSVLSGVPLLLVSLYLSLCSAKDTKGRIFSAILTYAATGILAFGMIEG